LSKDLREYTKQTQNRLIYGFLLLVFLVGDGLIFYFYGVQAGVAGLICLSGIMVPVLLVALFLWITDRVVKRDGR
jgi:hypothetical protein